MEKELLVGLYSLVSLEFFSMFSEYFFSVSTLYVLLAVIVITYNTNGLILQRALSESLAFVLFMTGYLIFNDDLLVLNFLNFNHSILNDQFAFFIRILICIFSAIYFLIVASCLKEQKIISFEYPLIILLAVLGLLLMCNSNDFLITYLAIELATLAFYLLASFYKTSNCSVDSAVKYFIIGAVSSAFFLLGSSFIYGFTGSINFFEFSVLLGNKFDWIYSTTSSAKNFIDVIDSQFEVLSADEKIISFHGETFDMFICLPHGTPHGVLSSCFFDKILYESMCSSAAFKTNYVFACNSQDEGAHECMPLMKKDCGCMSEFKQKFTPVFDPANGMSFEKIDSLLHDCQNCKPLVKKDCGCMSEFKQEFTPAFDLANGMSFEKIDFLLYDYLNVFQKPIFFVENAFDTSFVEFGLIFILFSLFIKLASAPFHVWSLDVYEGVPISSAFFFAVLTKLSLFVLLIRLCYQSFITLKSCWQFYFLAAGLFSIFVGSFGGLKEKRLKTLLAYSSISHMGYALIAFSTATFIGIQMLLLYVFIYMLSGLSIWYLLILLVLKKPRVEDKYSKELSDLVQLKKSNLMLAITLSLSIFSIAGIPPLIGFFAKLNVFLAVVGDFFYVVGLVSILCSVVSTFYYIRIVKVLYFENILVGKLYFPIKSIKTVILSVLNFLLIFLFGNPTILSLINYKSVLSLL